MFLHHMACGSPPVRLGLARFGTARLESARFGSARLGSARRSSARPVPARLGSARARSARLGSDGPARLGLAGLGSARVRYSNHFGIIWSRSPNICHTFFDATACLPRWSCEPIWQPPIYIQVFSHITHIYIYIYV